MENSSFFNTSIKYSALICVIENLSLQENTRFCWPVRPIPRRSLFHEDMNDSLHPNGQSAISSNTAIGVVTPNSATLQQLHHQQQYQQHQHQQQNDQISNIFNTNTRNNLTPDSQLADAIGTAQSQTSSSAHGNIVVEDRLNQIQEYIRITSSLINSIQTDKVSMELLK